MHNYDFTFLQEKKKKEVELEPLYLEIDIPQNPPKNKDLEEESDNIIIIQL